jgi:hypothetical protein
VVGDAASASTSHSGHGIGPRLTVDLREAAGIGDTEPMRPVCLPLLSLLLPLTAQDAAKGAGVRWFVFAHPGGAGMAF